MSTPKTDKNKYTLLLTNPRIYETFLESMPYDYALKNIIYCIDFSCVFDMFVS